MDLGWAPRLDREAAILAASQDTLTARLAGRGWAPIASRARSSSHPPFQRGSPVQEEVLSHLRSAPTTLGPSRLDRTQARPLAAGMRRRGRHSRSLLGLLVALVGGWGLAPGVYAEAPYPFRYVELGLASQELDRAVRLQPAGDEATEPVTYSRAFGGYLRASWQAAHGWLVYGSYLASDGCAEECQSPVESQGTAVSLERSAYGIGYAYPLGRGVTFRLAAGRERHRMEQCTDRSDAEEGCRRTRYNGYSAAIGARLPISERWSLHGRYAHYLDMPEPEAPVLRLGQGRFSATAACAVMDGQAEGVIQYVDERNAGLRLGLRFLF